MGLMREKNSERVAALDLKQPVTELVMVQDPGFSTPRITMHMCLCCCVWWVGGWGKEKRGPSVNHHRGVYRSKQAKPHQALNPNPHLAPPNQLPKRSKRTWPR